MATKMIEQLIHPQSSVSIFSISGARSASQAASVQLRADLAHYFIIQPNPQTGEGVIKIGALNNPHLNEPVPVYGVFSSNDVQGVTAVAQAFSELRKSGIFGSESDTTLNQINIVRGTRTVYAWVNVHNLKTKVATRFAGDKGTLFSGEIDRIEITLSEGQQFIRSITEAMDQLHQYFDRMFQLKKYS